MPVSRLNQSLVQSPAGSFVRRAAFSVVACALVALPSLAQGQAASPKKQSSAATTPAKPKASTPAPDGKTVFTTVCAACHQANGEGLEDKYPPLAGSEWVAADEGKLIRIILQGLTGSIEVEGQTFDGLMPPWGPTLGDPEIAAVATYVRKQFGNGASAVTPAKVASIRAATKTRTTPWTVEDLARITPTAK